MAKLVTALLICALSPAVVFAQTGREFLSVEAMVAASRIVYVGKIAEFAPADYDGPLVAEQVYGKPYRIRFHISETLRGEKQESLELILSIQSTLYLEYLCDSSAELMLIAGSHRLGKNAGRHIGITEQGRVVNQQWYHFRLLNPLDVPAEGDARVIASQINRSYDACRMFTSELKVVRGRDEILHHARNFARKTQSPAEIVLLRIPNAFAELCGTPNAYCLLVLSRTEETRDLLKRLLADPGLITRQVDPQHQAALTTMVIDEARKTLDDFVGSM